MIKLFFKLLIGKIRFRVTCYKADLLHAQTGKRYYVIPTGNGKLFIMNSAQRKELQRKKIMKKNIDYIWLMRNALYYTCDTQSAKDANMPKQTAREKEQMFIKHLEKHYKN